MKVFRITTKKWSDSLTASGFPARWNSKGKFVIYTSGTRALACLENIVHRSGEGLNSNFKIMEIEYPNSLKISVFNHKDLPPYWFKFQNYHLCQALGDQWLNENITPILKVPSAIIKQEYNFLFNPSHPDFSKIKMRKVENFDFDPRLK